MEKLTYKLIGCGGTFDLLHKGHRDFLRFALSISEKVLIGLSTDEYSARRKEHLSEPYSVRKENLEKFLGEENAVSRVEIANLESVYIPKEWDYLPIEAILVTKDSEKGAEAINKRRVKEGRAALKIIKFQIELAEDGLPISSSRIREGNIDREGKLWVKKDWYRHSFFLPQTLRPLLQKPFGEIVDAKTMLLSDEETGQLAAVGDVTVMLFNKRNIVPKLRVVDLMVERKRKYQNLSEMGLKDVNLTYSVQNTPGQISSQVFRIVGEAFYEMKKGKTAVLVVDGEEDLVVLPVILHAPIGWIVCYGQPKSGTVKVVVDEDIKRRAKILLEKFTIR